jgi:hypothetical protein
VRWPVRCVGRRTSGGRGGGQRCVPEHNSAALPLFSNAHRSVSECHRDSSLIKKLIGSGDGPRSWPTPVRQRVNNGSIIGTRTHGCGSPREQESMCGLLPPFRVQDTSASIEFAVCSIGPLRVELAAPVSTERVHGRRPLPLTSQPTVGRLRRAWGCGPDSAFHPRARRCG